jgi:hypothetical protein
MYDTLASATPRQSCPTECELNRHARRQRPRLHQTTIGRGRGRERAFAQGWKPPTFEAQQKDAPGGHPLLEAPPDLSHARGASRSSTGAPCSSCAATSGTALAASACPDTKFPIFMTKHWALSWGLTGEAPSTERNMLPPNAHAAHPHWRVTACAPRGQHACFVRPSGCLRQTVYSAVKRRAKLARRESVATARRHSHLARSARLPVALHQGR